MEYDTKISGNIGSGQIGGVHIADGSLGSGSIGSGQISQFHLASGAVNSGQVSSGAVLGSVGGGAFTIASGTLGPNDLGSGSVLSGAIASGQIVFNHLGSGAVLSGAIASGQVGNFAVSSGAITSGRLGVTNAPDGTKFLRDDFTWNAPTTTINSGDVGSGDIASGVVQGFFGTTRNIASGTVGVFDFGSGAVVAGTVGSGAIQGSLGALPNTASGTIGPNDLGSGSVRSGALASGQIALFKLSSGAVNSGQVASGAVIGSRGGGAFTIASGTIGPNDLGSGSVLSGAIASGQIGTFHISSGTIVTYARNVIIDQYRTSETISGVRGVQFNPLGSGSVRIAMAAVSGRFPANGIAFGNALSGQSITLIRFGEVLGPSSEIGSGLIISGAPGGRSLWLGCSGQVLLLRSGDTASGPFPSIGIDGGTNSGIIVAANRQNSGGWGQRIGCTTTSGAVLIDMVPFVQFSGLANDLNNAQQWPPFLSDRLYITADAIGTQTGGGHVTFHESTALAQLGSTEIWQFDKETRPWKPDRAACARLEALPDLKPVHAHFYSGTFSQTIDVLRARGTKITYTAAAHDTEASRRAHEQIGVPFDYPHLTEDLQWKAYLRGYLEADVVICPSPYSAKIMQGYGCRDVRVIPHGHVPPDRIAPVPVGRFVVGYLGQPGPDKGLVYLLQAWDAWTREHPSVDALLVLAGRGTLHVLPWIRSLCRSGSFYVQGEVAAPSDLYDAICVYVQPSVSEGFGCEVVEARAHGRPVICSSGAGAHTLANHIVPACNVPSLVHAIDLWYARWKEDPQALSTYADPATIAHYSWERVRALYVDMKFGLA